MRTEKTECRMPNCQRPHIRGECDKNCYYNTRQVMTHYDEIRAMSVEELAKELLDYFAAFYDVEWTVDMLLEWLKQEVSE